MAVCHGSTEMYRGSSVVSLKPNFLAPRRSQSRSDSSSHLSSDFTRNLSTEVHQHSRNFYTPTRYVHVRACVCVFAHQDNYSQLALLSEQNAHLDEEGHGFLKESEKNGAIVRMSV